jgi:murein DD-endopeptidase MepM/ murein hydrolase activator NlpD
MKLSLAYPMKPYVKTQGFGDSWACYDPATKVVTGKYLQSDGTFLPCVAPKVDLYAYSGMKGHNGIDQWAPSGAEVRASLEGIVDEIETEPSRGLGVGVVSQGKYETAEGEYNIKLRYWHLKGINVTKGQVIKVGDLLGWEDNTGYSAGDHLHQEGKHVKDGKNVFQNNGYYGAFDISLYWNGTYANPTLRFTTSMKLGETSENVKQLQQFLIDKGYMDYPAPTGFYGTITRNAVFLFQQENIVMNWYESFVMKGSTVGSKTLKALNDAQAM